MNDLACLSHFQFFDARFFAHQTTQVEQTSTTYATAFDHLNGGYIGVGVRENALYAYTVRQFANGKGFGGAVAADLDHVTAEILLTGFVALNNFVGHDYRVARFEGREFR